MTLVDRLLNQLAARGLTVGPGDKPGELKLHGKTQEADKEVMRAIRAFKPQLLERFGRSEPKAEVIPEPEAKPPEPEPQPEAEPNRAQAVNAVLMRASADKKRVFGFSSQKASCAEVAPGNVPDEWDRLCVEGDAEWTSIPPA